MRCFEIDCYYFELFNRQNMAIIQNSLNGELTHTDFTNKSRLNSRYIILIIYILKVCYTKNVSLVKWFFRRVKLIYPTVHLLCIVCQIDLPDWSLAMHRLSNYSTRLFRNVKSCVKFLYPTVPLCCIVCQIALPDCSIMLHQVSNCSTRLFT